MQSVSAIKLVNVSKSYLQADVEHVIFSQVSIEIEPGQFVVLIGKSGSGKSTLLNLISGIDLPECGDIFLGESCVSRFTERERTLMRRRNIGFIFQSLNLLPMLTVEENLKLPLELNGKNSNADHSRCLSILAELGLGDRRASYPHQLSGGEQQRIAIARALVHEPSIILADEPTGNLDLETANDVLELLDRLVRRAGKTMVMVTHSREVIGLADRILTIRNGQLVESDNIAADHDQLSI